MIKQIRQKLLKGEYIITRHAQRRCDIRKISLEEIKNVVNTGEIIENYPHDKPYPSCLIMGYVQKSKPLYCLVCPWRTCSYYYGSLANPR